ncbi:hypothetical protein ACFPVX_15100 [Cohnella faecalis]|uniref:Uncharacterized protein n=1 Tax=Cohnella faecalis TaxID=2315694 RepID=A0A398CH16_9BACL|nr:hypothetical protein [Cohnella faecalis]RIE01755.1 hypothetical protein D3H35_13205 [Cohnella faecalis]
MKKEELEPESIHLLREHGISWDGTKSVYMTALHKNFYLKEAELRSDAVLKEFCDLIVYLKTHPEYGVSTDWASSELNRYVYMNNKEAMKTGFPSTIEALSRFYDDSSIIRFYKDQGAKAPTIIDLIGTTGAGKTTFCQQFVDDSSKDLLKLTITDSAESTVMQTDILILQQTSKKMFLRARSKADIMKDIMTVALELDLTASGATIKELVKKNAEIIDKDMIDKVSHFFSTDALVGKFTAFADQVQTAFKADAVGETARLKWIKEHSADSGFVYILDDEVANRFPTSYFYGYLQEYDLETDADFNIVRTITNTEFKYRKEDLEDYPEMADAVSDRLLFDHAILVLPCSAEAQDKLEYDFQQGIVFRDSQGHKLDEQNGIASDFEVKNKIFLIPIDTGGYLIDDRYSNIFERILISEPKNNVFVLTKVDLNTTYKRYKDSHYLKNKDFNRVFSDKIARTHNKLISTFQNQQAAKDNGDGQSKFYKDETALFTNFMASFSNAYLSEIDGDTFAAEGHKIAYAGQALEELDRSKLDIEYLESWFDIVGGIIKENKLTYHDNIVRIANPAPSKRLDFVERCKGTVKILMDYYISTQKWQDEIDGQLAVFNVDFRTVYQKGDVWYRSNFINDGNTTASNSYFKDLTRQIVKDINSYVIKGTTTNYVKSKLQEPLTDYLTTLYSSKKGDSAVVLNSLSNKIIQNSLERAAKIAYKVFDRKTKDHYFMDNIRDIFKGSEEYFTKPKKITLREVERARRAYSTYTEHYAGIYGYLLARHTYNLETYFLAIFQTVIESELHELNEKVK